MLLPASTEIGSMTLLDLVGKFHENIGLIESHDALFTALSSICAQAGFSYFAITHHANISNDVDPDFVRIHNYPDEWVGYFDANGLGARDPVHRASQLRGAAFPWSSLESLLPLTAEDRNVLARARSAGIGDGYTVPFHVPGEYSGSCSFAVTPGATFPQHQMPLAQALGMFAFEAARGLRTGDRLKRRRPAHLTSREREIVVWLGHGKQEKEIARILGISPNTVNDHLKHARARCGVHKSSLLVVCGLLTGSITYSELLAA